MLELGDGDVLAVGAAGIEALGDGQLDGPEIAEALEGGVIALGKEIVVALLDAAIGGNLRVERGLGGDDQALSALDLMLRLEDFGIMFQSDLQALVKRVGGNGAGAIGFRGRRTRQRHTTRQSRWCGGERKKGVAGVGEKRYRDAEVE